MKTLFPQSSITEKVRKKGKGEGPPDSCLKSFSPSTSACLALPKLNMQFLTLHDYLLRNFILFRLESTCWCPPPPPPHTSHTAVTLCSFVFCFR